MKNFYERLSYSFGNEDWRTEQEALQLTAGDRVLCITGSGDRPLNLLTTGCKEVIAIDLNPIQNHLLALKKNALKALSSDEYLRFLGITDCNERLKTLEALPLDKEVLDFWLKNKKMIAKGVLYQGATERLLSKCSSFLSLVRKDKVERLFSIDNLEEQKAFVKKHWNKPLLRRVMEVFLRPSISKLIINDPGLTFNLMPSLNIGTYLYDRIQRYLERSLAKESLLLNLMLNKKVSREALPPYLSLPGIDTIRRNIHALSSVTDNLITYLENVPENSFDGFSIADVASYLSDADYHRLLHAMKKAGKPGSRFCMRQFLSAHHIPEALQPNFTREPLLEDHLDKSDNCMFYRFMVGTINK
ncbi:MAG: DUF3419 family protein [Chlamydiota bacterium]